MLARYKGQLNETGFEGQVVVVKTEPGCSLFDLGGLLEDLQNLLGCPVDLVTDDGLRPRLRERILNEAIPL